MRALAFGCGLLLLPFVAGCAGGGEGKVSGRVLLDGTPVPGGWVMFRPADPAQNSVSAELDEGGNFAAVLPAGEVQISVDNRELEPLPPLFSGAPPGLPPEVHKALGAPKAGKPPAESAEGAGKGSRRAGRYVPIPERYYDIETSGLKLMVKRGDQKHDIELTK
jgi:hypothetical protein